jgi:threonine dehydrogenase-like Zn-dependent dehydrogenase
MQALLTTPGVPETVRVGDVREGAAARGGLRLRTLEVGVCGTDREIAEGAFGAAPPGEEALVLGHEFLGEVLEDGHGFSAGDLVTATVRRSCGRCAACAEGSPDACQTGDYTERGITGLHGFACEAVREDPAQLIAVPRSLGRVGVLAEPASICARALRHARAIGTRQPWAPRRALIIGAGAIGVLATYMLRLEGSEVWTAARGPAGDARAELIGASGARYVSTKKEPLTALREEVGGFDLVVEAAGNAEVMHGVLGLLGRNGVGCLLGLDAHAREIPVDSTVVAVDTVLENRVLFGSVNAHRQDWETAVSQLDELRRRLPEPLEAMVGLRVPPDRFAEAFGYRGVKATLRFA